MTQPMSLIEFSFEPLGGHRFRLIEDGNPREWEMTLNATTGRGEIYVPTMQEPKTTEGRIQEHSIPRTGAAMAV